MNIFAGKTPTERNKIIAALVLGAMALFSLYLAFGGSLFSRKPSVTVNVSPSPSPSPGVAAPAPARISPEEIYNEWTTTPIEYNPGNFGAPEPGRNIFAFYEPPPPTPYVPPPAKPTRTPTPEPPPPPPPLTITYISPESVYAGTKTFRLDVSGEDFTPETRILFNGSELPTIYISPQRLTAEIPANLILGEGPRQIMVCTPNCTLYSNQFLLKVEGAPKPQLQYIGMIARKRYNNDTAYFVEEGKNNETPTGARLNDVVAGRFRLVSISAKEVVFEDVNLGFRHKLALYVPPPGQAGVSPSRTNVPSGNYVPYTPPNIQQPQIQQQEIPGIPNNIPRYNQVPSQQVTPKTRQKDDDDDDDDDPDDGRQPPR